MFILKFFLFWNDHTDGWVCKTACAHLECITRALSPAPEWNSSLWSFFFKVLCVAPSPNCIPCNQPRGNHPTGICVNHLLDLFSSFIIQDRFLKMGDQPQKLQFSSVQLLSHVNPLWLHGLQHTMPPCPSPAPGACSNSCPFSQWSHSTIFSSVVPFSVCLQSFPASGSFPMSHFFASSVQSIGSSASASVLPMNIQDWFPIQLTDLTAAFLSWNDWRMLKSPVVGTWNMVNTNHGVHLSHQREWSPCTLYGTEDPWKHGAQWEKPVTKGHML